MNRLLVMTTENEEYSKLLKKMRLPDIEIATASDELDVRESIRCSNILLGDPDMVTNVLDQAKCLQWVQSTYAGVEAFCKENLRRDYVLTGVKNVFGPMMSQYVFGYIFCFERHLFETRQNQKAIAWRRIPYRRMTELTLGICGLGSIGKHVAQTASHFGLQVVAYKKKPGEFPYIAHLYTGSSFEEFLGILDYLVLALPHTDETSDLINCKTLRKMKTSSVLINIGRGNAIVEADLACALKNRVIRAAVLDVFRREPLSSDSVLWGLPNAFITPHNAAVSLPKDIVKIFSDNYRLFLAKKTLQYVVDFEKGY